MNAQISKYVCWLGHFFDEPEIFENKEIYMVACPVCHSETIHANIAHLTRTEADLAEGCETAAPNANNLSDQHTPQAETPGK